MKGDDFEWTVVDLEVERCKLEKFGDIYQDVFRHMELNNFYCFKDINNFILEGHFSYYLYSFFILNFSLAKTIHKANIVDPLKISIII